MKQSTKQVWVLAGGNGAGKSTFYRTRLAPLGLPFINADILAKTLYPNAPEAHSYDAAVVATNLRTRLLQAGNSFCFETVFSHPSKIDFVTQAKTLGYEVVLIFIHLECTALNQARVAQRVSEGGHSVPSDKVAERLQRLVQYVKQALPHCDYVSVLDNSRADNPFVQIATLRNGQVLQQQEPMPKWARSLLDL